MRTKNDTKGLIILGFEFCYKRNISIHLHLKSKGFCLPSICMTFSGRFFFEKFMTNALLFESSSPIPLFRDFEHDSTYGMYLHIETINCTLHSSRLMIAPRKYGTKN